MLTLYAVTEGHMDDVAVGDIRRFEFELREHFKARHTNVLAGIAETGDLPEGDVLAESIAAFRETFEGSETVE